MAPNVDPSEAIPFPDAASWRRWLEEHHLVRDEVWMLYHKVSSGVPSIRWAEAVPVALCFGWIDGIARRVDEHRYMQRWTPRRPGSRWSNVNRDHVERLTAAGLMAPAGLAAVEAAKASGAWDAAYTTPPRRRAPEDLRAALRAAGEPARTRFTRLSTAWLDRTLDWVEGAPDEGERARRVMQVVESLGRGTRPELA